ncbi:hypothetical protein M5E87_08770 [Flavonifractor plautii]|nr:hypothetical protein M5E87_08770 [Flavonifractor plautii]
MGTDETRREPLCANRKTPAALPSRPVRRSHCGHHRLSAPYPHPHRRLHPPGRRADLPGGLSAARPYAVGAAMVGAGLADLLTAPLWVVPTLLIKAMVALLFTSRAPRLLCPRNGAALLLACLLSPAAYGLAACLLLGGVNAFWPQFLGTLVQAVGSGAVFTVLALALDRAGGKARLAPHSQG